MEPVFGVLRPSLPGLREGSLYWVQRMCSFCFRVLILGYLLSVLFVDFFWFGKMVKWNRWSEILSKPLGYGVNESHECLSDESECVAGPI